VNDSVTGRAIGDDCYSAQQARAATFKATDALTFPGLNKSQRDALIAQLEQDMDRLFGNAIITHCPGWDTITYAPNVSPGLDRPIPALAMQLTAGGVFVGLWVKFGPAVTDWTMLGAGGAVSGGIELVATAPGVPTWTANLVTNPSAEDGSRTGPTGWTGTGGDAYRLDAATAATIGIGGDPLQYLSSEFSVPRGGGSWVYCGGPGPEAYTWDFWSTTNVSSYATAIDGGSVQAAIAAWLSSSLGPGGDIPSWDDTVAFIVQFIAANQSMVLGSTQLGPAGMARSGTGAAGTHQTTVSVPASTRYLKFIQRYLISSQDQAHGGFCFAYADLLSCKLQIPSAGLDRKVGTIVTQVDNVSNPTTLVQNWQKYGTDPSDWEPLNQVGTTSPDLATPATIAVDAYGQLTRGSARIVIVTGSPLVAISTDGLNVGDSVVIIAGNPIQLQRNNGATPGYGDLRFAPLEPDAGFVDSHYNADTTIVLNQYDSNTFRYFVDSCGAGFFVRVGGP